MFKMIANLFRKTSRTIRKDYGVIFLRPGCKVARIKPDGSCPNGIEEIVAHPDKAQDEQHFYLLSPMIQKEDGIEVKINIGMIDEFERYSGLIKRQHTDIIKPKIVNLLIPIDEENNTKFDFHKDSSSLTNGLSLASNVKSPSCASISPANPV